MQLALEISKFTSVTTLTIKDALEALDGFLQGHQFTQMASEDLSHLEGLGQETLDLASTGHSKFVLFRQLIHTQNGNDILQGFVVLSRTELIKLFREGKKKKDIKSLEQASKVISLQPEEFSAHHGQRHNAQLRQCWGP